MQTEKIFKTKTGYCHILPDKIVLTRDGIIGNVSDVVMGKSITQTLTIYSGLAICFLYLAYDNYIKGSVFMSVPFAFFGLFLAYTVLTSKNNSATPVISRDCIKQVTLKRGVLGLTRSRFEVVFEDNHGNLKKRLIMLPGSLSSGSVETKKAIDIMTEEGFLQY